MSTSPEYVRTHSGSSRICLLSESSELHAQLRARSWPGSLSWFSTRETDLSHEQDVEHLLSDAIAVLVEWSDQTIRVIDALRERVHRQYVPLFALGRHDEADHVAALVVGADAFLPLPFSVPLFSARLRAYRRSLPAAQHPSLPRILELTPAVSAPRMGNDPDALVVGRLELSPSKQVFAVDGESVPLTRMEFAFVELLMSSPGTCFARDVILDKVWGIDFIPGSNCLDVLVYSLRQKLGEVRSRDCLVTVRSAGFKLVDAPVDASSSSTK